MGKRTRLRGVPLDAVERAEILTVAEKVTKELGTLNQSEVWRRLSFGTDRASIRRVLDEANAPPAATALPSDTPPAPVTDAQPYIGESLTAYLKRQAANLDELATRFTRTRGQILDELDSLRQQGVNLHLFGDKYAIEKAPQAGVQHAPERFEFTTEPNGEFVLGLIGDTHLGSKYCRLDVCNDLYDNFAAAGVKYVFHGGNWIEGEARFNKFDLLPNAHGMTAQVELFIRDYPQRKGIVTRFIDGDDHEGWYSQREGMEVGRYCELKAREAGRTDLEYLTYMDAFIRLVHQRTGEAAQFLLSHPGGGSSYAHSYAPQKLVESFQSGEKPDIISINHYHKMSYNLIRGVHAIQPGCTKDQDVFGRKKRLEYALGGVILRGQIGERGEVKRCLPEFLSYRYRGFYQNQWSQTGAITQAPMQEYGR